MSNDELSVLKDHIAALTARVTQIEDLAAIRRLHWAYGYYIDYNDAQSVSQLVRLCFPMVSICF